jgi:sugar transferase (PEP-CTERM/EpsH1 system associated)
VKVLFVCHRLPFPPRRGGKIRPFNIIKHLTESGHSVTVASLARSSRELEEGRGLEKYCARALVEEVGSPQALLRMVVRLPTATPSSMGYFFSPRLERAVNELLASESFDLVVVHCSSVAPYVAAADAPKILDFGDMDSQKWLLYASHRAPPWSTGYWLEGRKLEKAERGLAKQFDLCTCTTRAELDTLRSYDTGVATDWFPNGVDADFFRPDGSQYDASKIAFVGRMDYFPNQQAVAAFVADVLPLIRQRRPNVQLDVIGAAPSRGVRALGRVPGVAVTGTVEDVRPYVRASALTIAPLVIARGTQNKILESMAMGVPVVVSEAAAGGIDAEAETHFLLGRDPRQFADAVLRILDDPAERRRLADAGRERVLSHHSWPASMRRFDGIVARCLSLRRAPP